MQVDFIDSKLSADETRNAIIQACQNDFATVGTTALFLNNVTDMVNCKDQAGQATGLPDVPQLDHRPDAHPGDACRSRRSSRGSCSPTRAT